MGIFDFLTGRKRIDAVTLEELEEVLISGDIGVSATDKIIDAVKSESKRGVLQDSDKLIEAIKAKIEELVTPDEVFAPVDSKPYAILIVGVNGVGKTTSIAKLANLYKNKGKKVMLAAGDTFRAAAADQLAVWADRLSIPIIRQPDGSDPAAVIHDAAIAAKSRDCDILIADTAGRLHTKSNLMNELIKMERVIAKEIPGAPHERLLVLDGTSGQNALAQARKFKEMLGINGIILTKMDGTAKGGVIIRIIDELHIPVRYIGMGESITDIKEFSPKEFARGMF